MVTVNMKLKLLQCGDSGIHITMGRQHVLTKADQPPYFVRFMFQDGTM